MLYILPQKEFVVRQASDYKWRSVQHRESKWSVCRNTCCHMCKIQISARDDARAAFNWSSFKWKNLHDATSLCFVFFSFCCVDSAHILASQTTPCGTGKWKYFLSQAGQSRHSSSETSKTSVSSSTTARCFTWMRLRHQFLPQRD